MNEQWEDTNGLSWNEVQRGRVRDRASRLAIKWRLLDEDLLNFMTDSVQPITHPEANFIHL